MPNRKRTNKKKGREQNSPNHITTDDSKAIICRDRPVTLSEEKLKSLLQRAYEAANRNDAEFNVLDCYGILFFFAFALLIALLTANFKDFSIITAVCLERIAWFIFFLFCFLGIVFFCMKHYYKPRNEAEKRDHAVDEIVKELESISADNQYDKHDFSEYFTE